MSRLFPWIVRLGSYESVGCVSGCWPQGMSCESPRKRVSRDRYADTMKAAGEPQSTSLVSLPPELLVMVLERVGSYKEVARLRAVCRTFDMCCSAILRGALIELQRAVQRHARTVEAQTGVMMRRMHEAWQTPWPVRYRGQRALLRSSLCMYQAHTLVWQLSILLACTWTYITAGVCPLFYGELLDVYYRVLSKLQTVDRLGNWRPAYPSIMGHCRAMTWRFLKQYHYKVEKKLLRSKGDSHKGYWVILPGMVLIQLLETCLNKGRTKPKFLFQETEGTVRLRVSYVLEGSWLGISWTSNGNRQLEGMDSLQLCAILRDIIWVSNNEYLALARQKRDMTINGERVNRSYYMSAPSFNAVEDKGNRVYCYGHKARSSFGNGSLPRLVIHVDVTCHTETLPETLKGALQPAASAPPRAPSPEALSFNLHIVMESIELMHKWVHPSRYVYNSG